MSLLCHLSTHAAAPQALRNQGFEFSKCRRCGHDMIRSADFDGGEMANRTRGI